MPQPQRNPRPSGFVTSPRGHAVNFNLKKITKNAKGYQIFKLSKSSAMPKIRIVPDRRIMDALIKSGKALSISVLAKCEGRTSDKTVQVPSSHILDYKLGDRYIVSTKKGARTFIVAGMMVSRGDHRDFKNLFFLMKEDRVRAGKD